MPQPHDNQQINKNREKNAIHWFRKGLRLHDNPALIQAIKNASTFRCIFVIDPWFASTSNVGINKWRFLLQCLEDLDTSLKKLHSRLFVIRGQPADVFPKLFKRWKTTHLTFEEDPEPFGKIRDKNIIELCKELNIEVDTAVSHTLYNLETIIDKNGGQAPLTYHHFQKIISNMDSPVKPMPTVTAETLGQTYTPLTNVYDEKYDVPTLEELGFETDGLKSATWTGGEMEALARLERYLERKAWVASFGRPKMTPNSLFANQTGLSPYLRFGCLSPRLFYHELEDLYKKIKNAAPPISLHGQLLWREFFYCAATKNANFDKMKGNSICVQIPWDTNAKALAKWANSQTGFPWIDAIITQLREEGWIHHLARHAVAFFLTRGDLFISWEEGMKVFEELLLDADWSVNAGMWMWLSCSSFFQQFCHCYCPIKFGRKVDPNGDYIRRYLPILKNFPTKYIHEPWNAPESVQRTAKCIIGKDYFLPIVNHAVASRTNMERMKQAYQQLSSYSSRHPPNQNYKKGVPVSSDVTASTNLSTFSPTITSSPSPSSVNVFADNITNFYNPQTQMDAQYQISQYNVEYNNSLFPQYNNSQNILSYNPSTSVLSDIVKLENDKNFKLTSIINDQQEANNQQCHRLTIEESIYHNSVEIDSSQYKHEPGTHGMVYNRKNNNNRNRFMYYDYQNKITNDMPEGKYPNENSKPVYNQMQLNSQEQEEVLQLETQIKSNKTLENESNQDQDQFQKCQ